MNKYCKTPTLYITYIERCDKKKVQFNYNSIEDQIINMGVFNRSTNYCFITIIIRYFIFLINRTGQMRIVL